MLQGLLARARALGLLGGRAPPGSPLAALGEGPVATRPVDPIVSDVGPPAFARAGSGPTAAMPPERWSDDFGDAGVKRIAHRHGWLPSLAFAAGGGDAAAAERARDALSGWLRHDLPGVGPAWEHGSDLAARLVHWSAALSWAGPAIPPDLRALMAGSARWHLDHLQARMPTADADGARRVAHLCGMVVGGFTFPGVPDARAAWSEGLAGLRWYLQTELHPDGSPRDHAPARFAETLWYVAVARAVARANGAAFPNAADAAFARGARFLERLAGEIGTLPWIGEASLGDLLPTPSPLAWSLWNLVRAWGLDGGLPAFGASDDARLAWLGGGARVPDEGMPESAGKTWALWVYRESGISVAHMRVKGKPSRVVALMGAPGRKGPLSHPEPLHVVWDVGNVPVLADPGPSDGAGPLAPWLRSAAAHNVLLIDGHALDEHVPATPGVARVDGKKARIEGSHTGWHRVRVPFTHERDLLLNQARLVVTDRLVPVSRRAGRHAVRLSWQLGPGWELTPDGAGYIARRDGMTLVILLPSGLSWSVHRGETTPGPAGWVRTTGAPEPAPCLVGSGGVDAEATFVTSFEVR